MIDREKMWRRHESIWGDEEDQIRNRSLLITWVANSAMNDVVASGEQELDEPRGDEAPGARHAHRLLRLRLPHATDVHGVARSLSPPHRRIYSYTLYAASIYQRTHGGCVRTCRRTWRSGPDKCRVVPVQSQTRLASCHSRGMDAVWVDPSYARHPC